MDELEHLQESPTLDNHLCIDIRYADDTTLIAAVFEKLQLSTDQLQQACLKYGMKINAGKCKAISINQRPIKVDGNDVETVNDFIFLGSNVPSTTVDVKRRISLANTAFGKLKKNIWSRNDVPVTLKMRLYKALILPIAIYGAETWSLTKEDTRKLSVFENNCLRAILRIRLQDRISLKRIRKMAKLETPIENIIKKRRLTWFGHVSRLPNDSLAKRLLKEEFAGRRKRGRPEKRWQDTIREDTGLPIATAERYAQDRTRWRQKVNKWAKPCQRVC